MTGEPPHEEQEPGQESGQEPEQVVDPDRPHLDDGLDLARRTARSVAGSGLTPRRPRRKRRPGGEVGTRPTGDDRDPQLLDSTLSRLVADHGWALDLRVRGVFARWQEIVGDEIASHTTPETFAEGRLVVRTDSTAWATQLTLLAPRLVQRLNEDLGAGTVTVIEVLGPHLPTWRKGPRSTRDGRGPRDTYG